MTFRSKTLLAQAPLGLALVVLAILAVRTTSSLGAGAEAILKENYRSVLAAQRMLNALQAIDRAALFHVAGHSLDAAEIDRHVERLAADLAVEEHNITEPGEQEAAAQLRAGWDAYRKMLTELRAAPPSAASELYFGQLAEQFVAIRTSIDRILDLNQDAMLRKSDRARELAARMGTVMVVSSLAAVPAAAGAFAACG